MTYCFFPNPYAHMLREREKKNLSFAYYGKFYTIWICCWEMHSARNSLNGARDCNVSVRSESLIPYGYAVEKCIQPEMVWMTHSTVTSVSSESLIPYGYAVEKCIQPEMVWMTHSTVTSVSTQKVFMMVQVLSSLHVARIHAYQTVCQVLSWKLDFGGSEMLTSVNDRSCNI